MKRIHLITGGQRSGKSRYAEELALRSTPAPLYVATARVGDDAELRRRVALHQARRGPEWGLAEEPEALSRVCVEPGRTVLVDSVTMWCTNLLFAAGEDADAAFDRFMREFDRFTAPDAVYIFVTDEIGLGGIAANSLQRRFTDLLGLVNQYIAARADAVTLLVSGLPLQVK